MRYTNSLALSLPFAVYYYLLGVFFFNLSEPLLLSGFLNFKVIMCVVKGNSK